MLNKYIKALKKVPLLQMNEFVNKLNNKELDLYISTRLGPMFLSRMGVDIDIKVLKEIFLDEEYSTDYMNSYVVDIGAHKGFFAMYAFLHGASDVWSFEPEPNNFNLLKRTYNSVKDRANWQIENNAVGTNEDEIDFFVYKESWSHSVIKRNDVVSSKIKVRTVSLESILNDLLEEKHGSNRKIIVKVDAEGSECDIVCNTSIAYWNMVNEVLLEFHDFANCKKEEIIQHLSLSGFSITKTIGSSFYHFKQRNI